MRRKRLAIAIALAAIVLLVAGIRLALDPLATWRTRRALAGLHGMRARFSRVEVRLHDLSYAVRDLRIDKVAPGGATHPFFSVREARFGLLWRELLHGHLVARIDLDAPRLDLVQQPATAPPSEQPRHELHQTPEIGRRLEALAPFLLDRVQVRDGEVLFVDASEPGEPVIRFHHVEATLENFATRPALSRGEPTVLAARGTLQRTGHAEFFATADPLAKKLTFAGQGRVQGLRLAELGGLLGAKSDVAPEKGVLDMTLRFRADGGALTGGVRPILKGAETRPARPGLGARIRSALADAALHLFKDEVPGRHAVATTIPITGRVDDPDLQLVPTVLGVVRNAFVRGLADSLQGLPPPKAKEREGVVQQARRALRPSPRAEPRAQPTPQAQQGGR